MIAHYHWQVGLVADGRLLAAAAAASSDTVRGLACSARVSLYPAPLNTPLTLAGVGGHESRAGSCSTQGRPPSSGSWCGPQAGRGGEPGRLSHFLPFLLPSPPAHPPPILSCFPIEIGRAWVTRRVAFPPRVQAAGRGGGRGPPPLCGPRPSLGFEAPRRCGAPLLASFSKVPADTKAVS